MSLYLDASAIVAVVVDERASDAASGLIAAAGEPVIVSEFAAVETASAVARLVRMGSLSLNSAGARLAEFDIWRARVSVDFETITVDFRVAGAIVRRFDLGLRAPDALHAAVCQRGDHILVTLDRRLAEAAVALGVRVELVGTGGSA